MSKRGRGRGSMEGSSAVNAEGKPFVQVVWGAERGQWTPDDAREVAGVILAAAEAVGLTDAVRIPGEARR